MVMIRAANKATKIAMQVMKGKGVKQPSGKSQKPEQLQTPYLQH